MIDWTQLQTVYGNAALMPELLARARRADDSGPVWDELWSHLCHQGTVASASYAAIGALTDICLQQRPRGYIAPLQLVGAIVAAEDGPEDPAQVRWRYARELAELAELAEQCLPLSATDADFLYGLETWMTPRARGAVVALPRCSRGE